MGYYIRSLPTKKSPPKWKVQFISFKKADASESKAKKPKRHWDISKPRWPSLGFNNFMTKIEARARAKQLNAQFQIKRQEEQLRKIAQEKANEQLRFDAVLPSEFVAEFEARFIRSRNNNIEQNRKRTTRAYVRWRSAQRMIAAIGIEPAEWFYHYDRIYDYFFVKQVSVQYLQSILKIANLWGFFICRKLARPFLPVPPPRASLRIITT